MSNRKQNLDKLIIPGLFITTREVYAALDAACLPKTVGNVKRLCDRICSYASDCARDDLNDFKGFESEEESVDEQ